MGEPKGLVLFEGRPWIETQLESLGPRRVVVVLGHDRERYLEAVPGLARPAGPLQVVVNPDPERGPFSSLQVGLSAVARSSEGAAFVLPLDVPAASAATWAAPPFEFRKAQSPPITPPRSSPPDTCSAWSKPPRAS